MKVKYKYKTKIKWFYAFIRLYFKWETSQRIYYSYNWILFTLFVRWNNNFKRLIVVVKDSKRQKVNELWDTYNFCYYIEIKAGI